ncbi:hypothetical protein PI125_g19705 [Phytophthora idaei]|nr:hypothetical protein PI125_g19705 [Phytophthora idaei]
MSRADALATYCDEQGCNWTSEEDMNVSLSFTNRLQDPSLCVTVVTADIETHHSTEPFVPHRRQPLGPPEATRSKRSTRSLNVDSFFAMLLVIWVCCSMSRVCLSTRLSHSCALENKWTGSLRCLPTLRNRSMNGRFRRQLNHVVVV